MNRILIWPALALACLAGCKPTGPTRSMPVAAVPAAGQGDAHSRAPDNGPDADDHCWQACYLQGEKVGYADISTRRIQADGHAQLEITALNHMHMRRFGVENKMDVETVSLETPQGDVLSFRVVTSAGTNRVTVVGRLVDGEMDIETTVAGVRSSRRMPWQSDFRGFQAPQQSLENEPMQPGDTRSLKQLQPMLNQVVMAEVQLIARNYEETKLLDRTERLLHIDATTILPGAAPVQLHAVIWTDRAGRALKMETDASEGLQAINYRTTRQVALAKSAGGKFDVGFDPIVRVQQPLPDPWLTRRVRYRVELDGEDPAKKFPASANQQITPLGPSTVEILVLAPSSVPAGKAPAVELPTPEESAPSGMIQSADPTIVAMAKAARGGKTDPLDVAYALEKYVHGAVAVKDFSQAFSSALEVARSKQGDCTEHAVLLAALARASGIPSRVAIGLVYVKRQQGFVYHMWTEVFVGNRWLPLDATLGRGGIGASHLKLIDLDLADSDADGKSAFASLISVMQVLGRLKISVLEAE